ncbi:hypothetical protein Tco_1169986 [Tanacetum coccineum]
MTRSTVKRLTEPLDKPEREFQRLRRAALRSHQNDSLAIAGRNLFDDEDDHDMWDDMSPPLNISSISETMQPTFRRRLKRACNQISYLETPTREVGLKTPYLICNYCEGSHEADECKQLSQAEQVCLSGGDIYNYPSLLSFYQNDDTSPWGNNKRKEKGENGPEWIVRNKFEDELANFMLEKKSHAKGI